MGLQSQKVAEQRNEMPRLITARISGFASNINRKAFRCFEAESLTDLIASIESHVTQQLSIGGVKSCLRAIPWGCITCHIGTRERGGACCTQQDCRCEMCPLMQHHSQRQCCSTRDKACGCPHQLDPCPQNRDLSIARRNYQLHCAGISTEHTGQRTLAVYSPPHGARSESRHSRSI